MIYLLEQRRWVFDFGLYQRPDLLEKALHVLDFLLLILTFLGVQAFLVGEHQLQVAFVRF